MSNIRIFVQHPGAQEAQKFDLPADKPIRGLARVIAQKLDLEVEERVPRLHDRKSGRILAGDDTLSDAGIADNDALELLLEEVAEPAGEEAESEGASEEESRPEAADRPPPAKERPSEILVGGEPPIPIPVESGSRAVPWMLGLGTIIVAVVVLAIFARNLLPGEDGGGEYRTCETVDECFEWSMALREEHDLEGALELIEKAVDRVRPHQHAPYAFLLCEKGRINAALRRHKQAVRDFERCIDWTEGDPDLEHLRNEAELELRELHAERR